MYVEDRDQQDRGRSKQIQSWLARFQGLVPIVAGSPMESDVLVRRIADRSEKVPLKVCLRQTSFCLLPRPFARLHGPIGIVLLLEFTRIDLNRLSRAQKRLGVGNALTTVMKNSERFGRKGVAANITSRLVICPDNHNPSAPCSRASIFDLSPCLSFISSLKTFARLRTRRFAPAMPTPTSFSFTFPAYLTCPSSLA